MSEEQGKAVVGAILGAIENAGGETKDAEATIHIKMLGGSQIQLQTSADKLSVAYLIAGSMVDVAVTSLNDLGYTVQILPSKHAATQEITDAHQN